MNARDISPQASQSGAEELGWRMAARTGTIRANAQTLDASGLFPVLDVAWLRTSGALAAVIPIAFGGLGVGTDSTQATATANILHGLGVGSIALGRIFEAHLNAVRLVMRFASVPQRLATARDVLSGHLHALWVTDGEKPLCLVPGANGIALSGTKMPASAAGHATRAVVTARDPDGNTRLLIIALDQDEVVTPLASPLQGVRASTTGRVDFNAIHYSDDALFGLPDDYLREPEFSIGAWRAAAIAAGAIASLVEIVGAELVARGRISAPQQAERFGNMLIHAQTAKFWTGHAAEIAENADTDPDHAVATIQLARTAIDHSGLETIQLTQRCLGLSALLQSNPAERICRDLATYLRQPAPDESITAAATYFAALQR